MKPAVQFIARQSGWLSPFVFLFALAQGGYVCQGLWQGSGLHGYIIVGGNRFSSPTIISVWSAFIQALAFASLACLLFIANRRRSSPRVETRG